MIEATTIDALSSIALLIAITLLYPTKRLIHVFLDNARYHHAVLVQEWLAKPGCRIKVHYIPSYCSWLRLKARNRGELGRRSIRRLGEESGRTISATRPRLSTVWGWRALACPQDANSTIAEMALGRRSSFWPRLFATTLIDTHPLGSSGGLFRAQRTLLATTIQVRQQCPGPQATG
jgi:hypothetical protein